MDQSLLARFGTSRQRVEAGILALQHNRGILVADDENRENEVDLIFAAHSVTAEQMALLIRECSGIVCLCLPPDTVKRLGLPPMVAENTNPHQIAFTVSIEAASGVTTGVSAKDRVTTVQAAISPEACPADLNSPGHIFPLEAKTGGVLEREGHTEATVDMMRLSGLPPYGLLCELTHPDGTMVRLPQAIEFGLARELPVLTVQDIIDYRNHEKAVGGSTLLHRITT